MTTPPGFIPHEKKYSLIKVTSYRAKNLCGYLDSPSLQEEQYFSSLIHLLFLLEEIMDSTGSPQRGTQDRVFQPIAADHQKAAPPDQRERVLGTFQIQVLFRQNASWQGSLLWLERSLEARFRSVLELVHLLDSALQPQEEQE